MSFRVEEAKNVIYHRLEIFKIEKKSVTQKTMFI
jgi:hypothetical protein